MEKVHTPKQCEKHGEKSQSIVVEEHHQHFQNQEKIGNASKLLKNGREER
jgi:hypothetical protein